MRSRKDPDTLILTTTHERKRILESLFREYGIADHFLVKSFGEPLYGYRVQSLVIDPTASSMPWSWEQREQWELWTEQAQCRVAP